MKQIRKYLKRTVFRTTQNRMCDVSRINDGSIDNNLYSSIGGHVSAVVFSLGPSDIRMTRCDHGAETLDESSECAITVAVFYLVSYLGRNVDYLLFAAEICGK